MLSKPLLGVLATILLALASITLPAAAVPAPAPLTVAVAANLRPAFAELAAAYQKQTGQTVLASFGATGKFCSQIRQGAPFDLLLAADTACPNRLAAEQLTLQPPQIYAIGSLVIWTTREFALNDWPTLLQSNQIHHIAIANPDTAPYGSAAARALQHHKLLPMLEPKLIYGESIGQTNQFIATAAADVGFTAKATVVDPSSTVPGQWREVPADQYPPINQAAVLLKHADGKQRAAAEQFYHFLFSADARAIFVRYGYRAP